jgi:hypothetical protein
MHCNKFQCLTVAAIYTIYFSFLIQFMHKMLRFLHAE